jgi:hypothetical protein
MFRKSRGVVSAGIVALTLAAAACGSDRSSSLTGPSSGDTQPHTGSGTKAAPATPAPYGAAVGRSDFQVFDATGDIAPTVARFRTALGDPLNGGTPGPLSGGRREIKWDAVPAALTNVNTFPGDFFNTTVKAGAILTTDGTGFRNSDNDFFDINPAYAANFNAFSSPKTFMPIGSASLTVSFRVPGSDTPASTRGFGLVFSDVEREGAASIKLFDAQGRSLGQYHAPVRSDALGFSFVGVVFESPLVARVVIRSGQAALGPDVQDLTDGGNRDLVVMDDYLYAEPQALP